MANSKRALLHEYLRATLFPSITKANGYNFTVKVTERGIRNFQTMNEGEFPAIFIPSSTETRDNITGNQFRGSLSIPIVGFVKNSKTNPDASGPGVQQDLDNLIEDITKALETDRLQGGLVLGTEIKSVATDDGDMAPIAGCVVTVEFYYVSEGVTP